MDAFKLALKFFATDDSSARTPEFVPVFHEWIQQKRITDHVLIDVADYGHVVNGPGAVLVAHEANYATDAEGGRLGLVYARKQPFAATDFAGRLRETFASALRACALLEQAPPLAGRLRFRTGDPTLRFSDRLLAPNTPETFGDVQGALQAFCTKLYGSPVRLERDASDARTRLEVQIRADGAPDIATLLARLG